MTIDERTAEMRAAGAGQPQLATADSKLHVGIAAPEAVAQATPAAELCLGRSTNPVSKIMERDDLGDNGKLEALVGFLEAKNLDGIAAPNIFAELEVYITDEESRRTYISEQNIQQLMDELAGDTKSSIKRILDDFQTINVGAEKIKQLLGVLAKARSDGRTVEELTNAYRFNERLLHELASLRGELIADEKQEVLDARTQTNLEDERRAAEDKGIIKRFFFGRNPRLVEGFYDPSHSLSITQSRIQKTRSGIVQKEAQRDRKLEDEELTILCTVDVRECGLTDQIRKTAQDSLALIECACVSIERTIMANASSRAACTRITTALHRTGAGDAILKGALQVVERRTRLQRESLHKKVDKAAAARDGAQVRLLTMKLYNSIQTDQRALDFERVLRTTIALSEMLTSANVQSEARAQKFSSLIDAQRELLSNLQQQAVLVTTSALAMGLQRAVARPDGLTAAGVRESTKKGQGIFGANLDQLRAAIAALSQAQTLVVERTDRVNENGLSSIELDEQVKTSACAIRDAMAKFEEVDTGLTAASPPRMPPPRLGSAA
jgi:hypothetical protein